MKTIWNEFFWDILDETGKLITTTADELGTAAGRLSLTARDLNHYTHEAILSEIENLKKSGDECCLEKYENISGLLGLIEDYALEARYVEKYAKQLRETLEEAERKVYQIFMEE